MSQNPLDAPSAFRPEDSTAMFQEARSAAEVVRRGLDANRPAIERLAERLKSRSPPVVVTYARGSSDHAATYAKYLIETLVGVPTSSSAPSTASIFGAPVATNGAVCLAISQSGRSPDILAGAEAHRRKGNLVVALVNDGASPLAAAADVVLPLHAGVERSVAATKSYVATLANLALLTAAWSGDQSLVRGLDRLPQELAASFDNDWSRAIQDFRSARNMFVLGRGFSLPIAQEAALKLKETCALHAEAFSAAEVRHGPMTLVGKDFPVLGFATSDAAGDGLCVLASVLAGRGAIVRVVDPASRIGSEALHAIRSHPALEPILMIQSFYRFVNALSVARGLNPDAPPHLLKVTRTT